MLPLKSANSGRSSGALLLEASLSLLPIIVEGLLVGICRVWVGEDSWFEMYVAKRRLGGELGIGREGGVRVGGAEGVA